MAGKDYHNYDHKDYYKDPQDIHYSLKDHHKNHEDYYYKKPKDYSPSHPPQVKSLPDYKPAGYSSSYYPADYSGGSSYQYPPPVVRARPFDISFEEWLESSGVEAFGLPSDPISIYENPPKSDHAAPYQHVGQRHVVPNPGYDKPVYGTTTVPYDGYKTTERPYYGTFKPTKPPYTGSDYDNKYKYGSYSESPYSPEYRYTEKPYTAPVYIPKYEDTVYTSGPARYQESYQNLYLYSKHGQTSQVLPQ